MHFLRLFLLHRPVLALMLLGVPAFLVNYFAGRPGISGWDANFYYAYAGAIAETGRVDLDWAYAEMIKRGANPTVFDFRQRSRTGQAYNYFPIGHPLPHVPATLLGKWLSGAFERRGFSAFGPTAQFFYCLSCIAAAALGLGLMRREVARLFGAEAAGAGLLALFATSMLGYYWFILPALSHTTSLLVMGLMLMAFLRIAGGRGAAGWGWFGALGVAMGYMVAVRLQDAAFGAFGLVALGLLIRCSLAPGAKASRAAALVLGGLIGLLPQMILWKWKDGAWIYLGYHELFPETYYFTWLRPHLLAILFSPRHGLFLWHPALLAAFAGFLYWFVVGGTRSAVCNAGVSPASMESSEFKEEANDVNAVYGGQSAAADRLSVVNGGQASQLSVVNGGQASSLSRANDPDCLRETGKMPVLHSNQPLSMTREQVPATTNQALALALLLSFAGLWYIGASFSVWWFGDSFGSRPFLSALPLFWIGASWLWTRARTTALGRRLFWGAVLTLGVWNALLAILFHLGRISRSEPLTLVMILQGLGM